MKIPAFPQFKGIDLSVQNTFNDFLSRTPVDASEYTFTNIFAFRLAYDFKISVLGDTLIIFKGREPVSVYCPVGNSQMLTVLHAVFDFLGSRSKISHLERVPESFVSTYLKGNRDFIIEEDRDHFDYVYDTRELRELKGRKFHDKRNQVNKFSGKYRYEYLSLTPDLIEECLEFEEYWCEVRECGKYPGLERERCAIIEMLNNFKALNIQGGAVRIEDKIAALTLGEKILPDTFVIHIEKANPDFPGLYQLINQEFLIHEAGDIRFVNRQQDMGVEGLRKAKMSYNPVRFVKKYKIWEKNR